MLLEVINFWKYVSQIIKIVLLPLQCLALVPETGIFGSL